MSIVYDFFVIHGFVFELLLSVAMFVWRMGRRDFFVLRFSAFLGALLGISGVWNVLFPKNGLGMSLRYILFFAVCLAGVLFCFHIRYNQAIFLVTAAGVVQHFVFKAGRTAEFLTYLIFGPNPWSSTIAYPIFVLPLFVLCYLFFARKLDGNETDGMKNSTVVLLMIGMLICANLFQNLFETYSGGIGSVLYSLFELSDLINGLFLMALMYELFVREKMKQNSEILQHMLHQQKQQMETSKETIDLINIKCHDLKHQISMLGSHIPQEEIEELNRTISIYDSAARTGNEALDVLIAEKSLLCSQKQIRFDYIADGSSLKFMKPADIYALFGNALDNAMEAVSKIREPEMRYIRMKVRPEKGMLVIHFENRYDGQLDFTDGLPRTTKQDKRYHGFGMKSIRMIADKYHGYLSVRAETGIFTLNILLPMEGYF